MPVSSKALANYLLDLGDQEGIPVSPMKLQKLVYYCQGWHLAITGQPLIDEQIEAWRFGPVVNSLFHAFKEYGSSPIDARARRFRREGPGILDIVSTTPTLAAEIEDPVQLAITKRIIRKVWDEYKRFSATKLSNMTHEEGGPWHKKMTDYEFDPPRGTDIPMRVIKKHFTNSLNQHLARVND